MRNTCAFASITSTIRSLLKNSLVQNSLSLKSSQFDVTCKPLDLIDSSNGAAFSGLNIFLYQVLDCPHFKNLPPSLGEKRAALGNDRKFALVLYYLLTAYGSKDYEAEFIIQNAIQCFYETPILTSELINKHCNQSTGEVVDQSADVKITQVPLSSSDMSLLWTMFRSSYRLSVAYEVGPVVIQGE